MRPVLWLECLCWACDRRMWVLASCINRFSGFTALGDLAHESFGHRILLASVSPETHESLCPGCHAKVHRTKLLLSAMPSPLLELWCEQHPRGHEQVQLDFTFRKSAAKFFPLRRRKRIRSLNRCHTGGFPDFHREKAAPGMRCIHDRFINLPLH
jgi:hypothetical protein